VQLGELLDDGRAEARSAVAPRGTAFDLAEALEDDAVRCSRNTGAAILDLEHRLPRVGVQVHRNGAVIGRELEGVAEQLEQDALESFGIGLGRRGPGRLDRVADASIFGQ